MSTLTRNGAIPISNAVIKRHWCSLHLECLTVSLRPYFLPREFSHIIYNTIYVPNRNLAEPAAQKLCEIIDNIETSSPDALVLINGDSNYCSLKSQRQISPTRHLCYARENVTLDMFYSNVKDAYTSIQLPKLGNADHNLVSMLPKLCSGKSQRGSGFKSGMNIC